MPIYKKSKDAAAYLWVNGTKHPHERPSIHLRVVDGNWLWEPLFESHLCNLHVDEVQIKDFASLLQPINLQLMLLQSIGATATFEEFGGCNHVQKWLAISCIGHLIYGIEMLMESLPSRQNFPVVDAYELMRSTKSSFIG